MSKKINSLLEKTTLLYVEFEVGFLQAIENFSETCYMTAEVLTEDYDEIQIDETRFISQSTQRP